MRKHVVGVTANESDCADHDHEDNREHHCILSDVLTALLSAKLPNFLNHCLPPIDDPPELHQFLGTVVGHRVIVKISRTSLFPQ